MKRPIKRLVFILPLLIAPLSASARPTPDLTGIVYRQSPGAQLPLQIMLRDESGRALRLSDLFEGVPLILVLGYFHCPKLCNVVRADLFQALSASGMVAGRDYVFAALSVDPSETSAAAAAAKATDLQRFSAPGAAQYWRFLTGEQDAIRRIADAVGYEDRFEQAQNEFWHPVGVVFITPAGVLSSYLLGLGYRSGDVRAAVNRAASGKIAAPASPVLLLCFDFDPSTGRYSFAIVKVLRLLAAAATLVLGAALFRAFWQEGSGA